VYAGKRGGIAPDGGLPAKDSTACLLVLNEEKQQSYARDEKRTTGSSDATYEDDRRRINVSVHPELAVLQTLGTHRAGSGSARQATVRQTSSHNRAEA
jgi:hypothetical protein